MPVGANSFLFANRNERGLGSTCLAIAVSTAIAVVTVSVLLYYRKPACEKVIPAPIRHPHSMGTCSIEGCRRALAVVGTGTIATTPDISYPGEVLRWATCSVHRAGKEGQSSGGPDRAIVTGSFVMLVLRPSPRASQQMNDTGNAVSWPSAAPHFTTGRTWPPSPSSFLEAYAPSRAFSVV
jgi:hypothetical protein